MKKIIIFLVIFLLTILIPNNIHADTYSIGDVDGNGKVGANDYILIKKHILKLSTLTGNPLKRADVNNDNTVSSADYIIVKKIILGTYVAPTPTPTPVKDTTKPTITSCIAKVTSGYNTTYMVAASDDSGIEKYVHNNKEYYTNVFTVNKDVQNDDVRVYDKAGNYQDVTCSYEQIIDTTKNIVASYSSSTLKYWIENPNKYYRITHIWVKNAYNQLKVATVSNFNKLETIKSILNTTISNNNYAKKGMVAVNASASIMNSVTSDDYWKYQGYSSYKHSSRAAVIIINGKILRDFTGYVLPEKLYPIYGLKSNGYLASYRFTGNNSSYIESNKKVRQTMVNDGVKYTFSFSPVLVENFVNKTTNVTAESYSNPNVRQALCQVDRNNFIIITNYPNVSDTNQLTATDRRNGFNFKNLANLMVSLNCRTGYNLDGGGSLNLYYKKNTSTLYNIRSGNRALFDTLYFVEQ